MKTGTRFFLLYAIAFLASIGATMLTLGFFYFTAGAWGWDAKLNLALAAGMNAFYMAGSLMAHALSEKFGRRAALVVLYSIMSLICAAAAMISSHITISLCLLMYMFFISMTWPMLESLCSASRDAKQMSRQVGAYNLTWAIAGVIAVVMTGPLIEHWRVGIFVLPVMLHASTVLLMLILLRVPMEEAIAHTAHLDPEPDLLRSRKLALWLSRIALPAMYVVNFGVGAILPTLPVMRQFAPTYQTMYGSIWMGARLIVFAILGATAFWHTRPRLLLAASIGLLGAFLIVTLSPSLAFMIGGQILLGISMAMIYTASLYFGMVLSDGSTEHGGYHEALIGLGGVLGPGAGVVTQCLWPGDVTMAVGAVAGVVALSVIGAGVACFMLRGLSARRREVHFMVNRTDL